MRAVVLGMVLVSASASLVAQGDYAYRVAQEADQLKRATSVLADRTLRDLIRNPSNSRTEIQAALLAQQLDSGATVCVELIRNRRPAHEVRDVAAELADLARRSPSSSPQASLWRNVQTALGNLNRELGSGYGPPASRPIIGRVSWRGKVDDRVQLAIRGSSVETRTISGTPQPDGVVNFTSPLPASAVEVDVTKVSGRGTVKVLQQPAKANDFTAVIEIYDGQGGAQEYRLDIFWR